MLKANVPKLDPREEHFWVSGPRGGMQLFLRRLSPAQPAPKDRIVLYVHGGTFPSALSIAHRFDGDSWRDALCAAGFDVWAFDCYGFGASDRYPEMNEPATKNPSLCRAPEAAEQTAAAVRFILDQQAVPRLSIIAHSWGSIPAGRFAGEHPALVDRLVLFGPVAGGGEGG
jgi:pimeloyl-ACP methyl ester carboxylesterase